MEDTIINLELSVGEINTVLRSLGKHPFDEIAALIAKIKAQGEAQLAELQAQAAKDTPVEDAPAEDAK
jgi:hypothetical protein